MWSSKMAAPRRGKDGDLNAGNGDFPCGNTHNEFSLCRSDVSSQSCVDHHSILAIFEDSAISSEDKSGTEMESETLLSALTEMLDCVEDDVEVLSPFDTVPDTKLLRCPERRSQLADEACIADRLRPRSKPSLETLTEEENKADRGRVPPDLKQREPTRFQPKTTKPESEVEVFTSTSLVNLVRIMHPYCLRMHVEEEDKPRKRRAVFSQEEVWRYQRPTGDSDEEINVVSDEEAEATLVGRKEGTETANGKLLKSALLNGGPTRALPSRGKKRVSFGAIQVASFDEPAETRDGEAAPAQTNETKAPESQQQETSSEKVREPPPKAEVKAKSLSLQQYRQLRQKRQPLVEKQGNYTTKWPSVPEAPKELTPILCLQGRGPANRAPSQQAPLPQPSAPARRSALTRLRADAQIISPMSPLPDAAAEARRQTAPVSSDPPNPVLLRLHAEPSPQAPQPPPCSSAAPPSHLRNSEQCSAPQETKTSKPTSTHARPHSDSKNAHHIPTVPKNPQGAPPSSVPTTCQEIPTPAEDVSPAGSSTLPPVEGLKPDRREPTMAGDSGIEAPDLTSLLEQFEEKQAKAEGGSEQEPNAKVDSATLPLNLHSLDDAGAERPQTPSRAAPLKASEVLPDVQTVPEPLGTEVVLSAQGEQTARRKSPASKAIQIIDPRPLPPKRTNSGGSEVTAAHSSPHALSSVAADHDYCTPSWQRQPPTLRDADKSTTNVQAATPNLSAAECKRQLPVAATTVITAKAIPETAWPQQRSRPDSNPSTDRASVFSGQSDAGKEQVAPCTLPTPPPSPPSRGREKRRYRRRSPRSHSSSPSSSSSSSSSESRSPKRPRLHYKRSESSSCSSSSSSCSPPRRYRLSRSRSGCSRSRSRSWSQSRSRSRSPHLPLPRRTYRHRWRDVCSSRESRRLRREHEMRIQKLKAIDERRVVYVGRISRSMTHDELRERFSQFGEVECVSLHFRDKGDHYGFVTFYNMEDAFAAIDNGGKLRRPNELPFDICFGGRRQFCNSDYADLDANRGADLSPARSRFEELDFDSLLKQAQRGQKT